MRGRPVLREATTPLPHGKQAFSSPGIFGPLAAAFSRLSLHVMLGFAFRILSLGLIIYFKRGALV